MERLWTKQFTLITIGNLFRFNAFYILYPTLPPFIKQMGGNESQFVLAMCAFMLSAVIFPPLVGGLLLFTLAMYMYGWVGGITVMMGIRILHRMRRAVSTSAMITVITDLIPPTRCGEGMGWFCTSMTLAYGNRPDVQHLGYKEPIVQPFVFIRRRPLCGSAAPDVWCKNAFSAARCSFNEH